MNEKLKIWFVIAALLSGTCGLAQSGGDVAHGEVLSKTDKVLQLNTAPCEEKIKAANEITFVWPWKETVLKTETCPKSGDKPIKSYTEVQVEQLAPPPTTQQPTQAKPSAKPSSQKLIVKPALPS